MSNELIDLRKSGAWGERDRSLQVFRCHVCGSLTNKIGRGRIVGSYFVCPNDSQDWHKLFKEKLIEISNAKHRLKKMREELEILRSLTPPTSDLSGDPDMSQIGEFNYRGDFVPEAQKKKAET